jgi:hypothetical protein
MMALKFIKGYPKYSRTSFSRKKWKIGMNRGSFVKTPIVILVMPIQTLENNL